MQSSSSGKNALLCTVCVENGPKRKLDSRAHLIFLVTAALELWFYQLGPFALIQTKKIELRPAGLSDSSLLPYSTLAMTGRKKQSNQTFLSDQLVDY